MDVSTSQTATQSENFIAFGPTASQRLPVPMQPNSGRSFFGLARTDDIVRAKLVMTDELKLHFLDVNNRRFSLAALHHKLNLSRFVLRCDHLDHAG